MKWEEGFREGETQYLKEVALRMPNAGAYALKEISVLTKLSIDALQALTPQSVGAPET